MGSTPDGVGRRFELLRARLAEAADDDPLVAELLSSLLRAVARERALLDGILELLPIGVMLIDPSYRVILFNRRAREINGDLVANGMPLDAWPVELFNLDGTPLAFADRPAIRALHGRSSRGVRYEARSPDREPCIVDASAMPIREAGGEVSSAVTIFDDVTARRRREVADREFAANAAHQIGSPIAGIASALGALSAGAKDDPEARDRFLAHIERDVARMRQLASGLLALARAERGDTLAPLSMIGVKPLLQRVIELSDRKDGVEVELSCPERLTAYTNEALISEALTNVVTNAVHHTPRGTVSLRGTPTNGGASIEISDEGPGIAGPDRERVFERFFHGSRGAAGGVGLGLAIALAATRAAGGMLELVDSQVGACFRFTFAQTAPAG